MRERERVRVRERERLYIFNHGNTPILYYMKSVLALNNPLLDVIKAMQL